MNGQEQHDRFLRKHPHEHRTFFNRPHWTRRGFFEMAGAGVTASFLGQRYARAAEIKNSGMTTKNTAKNVIFVPCTGAPSHSDTFDLKMVQGVTPTSFAPDTIKGIYWPTGLMPTLANQLGDIAIVRSMRAWALVHSLAQTWSMIGRNPVAALGDIAPNIGSTVAIEKEPLRKPGQVFPAFVALNTQNGPGAGYYPATYAPFRVNQRGGTASTGVPNTTNLNAASGSLFDSAMLTRLHQYDDAYRVKSPYGSELEDYNSFYSAARGMMYNAAVNQAFSISAADSQRYGATQFGNACLV